MALKQPKSEAAELPALECRQPADRFIRMSARVQQQWKRLSEEESSIDGSAVFASCSTDNFDDLKST